MRAKILITSILVSLSFYLNAQNYLMNATTNNSNNTTCTGNLYDDGGASGNYTPGQVYVITFTPATAGTSVQLTFTQWNVDDASVMELFDGPTVASPSLGAFFNPVTPVGMQVMATAVNPTGQLTIRWTAGSTASPGFAATLSCHIPCQTIHVIIDSIGCVPDMKHDYIDVCFGTQVTFSAFGQYPQNDVVYHQSDPTSLFIWEFGDGVSDTGQVVTHTYAYPTGYDFSVTIVDSMGCGTINYEAGRVRHSDNPIVSIQPVPDMCMGDTVNILTGFSSVSTITIDNVNGGASGELNVADTTYLPDGSGVSYTSNLVYSVFPAGMTLTTITDLLGVCMNMEHSYLGDLDIKLTCPNGQFVQLKQYPGGTNTFLGEPIDNDANIAPCVGYDYCFSNTPTYGTMVAEAGIHMYTYTDCSGVLHTNVPHLPSGDYTPFQPLTALLGCPLNGSWTITITDHLASDNGYIFSWGLSLNPALIPGGWSYTVPIDSVTWAGPNISSTSDSTAHIIPNSPGNLLYTATVWDSYGCSYDTTFNVQVVEMPVVDLGSDTVLCGNNLSFPLSPGYGYSAYAWSTGETTDLIHIASTDTYYVTATNTNLAGTVLCPAKDSIYIKVLALPAPIDLGPDLCTTIPVVLDAQNAGFNYQWNTSMADTLQTFTATVTGMYTVTVAEEFGYNCGVSDSVHVTVMPVPTIEIGPDTAICSYNIFRMRVKDVDGYLDNGLYNYTYLWSTEPLSALNGTTTRNVEVGCLEIGKTYKVGVAVTGCTTVNDLRMVESKLCELTLPNIITPNGDGFNDGFVIKGIENFPGSNLKVYNRWGKKIYESDDYNGTSNAWDGRGEADGVYYYVLTVNYGEHGSCVNVENFNGTITLIR
ncbi:MAG: gliding motility-associated C-terminal domain-containing protein [Bacteroidota bacterium]